MKLNFPKETTIGLSFLLVLLIILGAVAVHRFTRPRMPIEASGAGPEEKRVGELSSNHPKHEQDLFPKSAFSAPVEAQGHKDARNLDDHNHWNAASNEKRTEGAAPAPIAMDSLRSPGMTPATEQEKRQQERKTIQQPETAATPSDDRYGTVVAEPVVEPRRKDKAESMVIQVSGGEAADGGPRRADRDAVDRRMQPIQPGPGLAAAEAMTPAPGVVPPPTRVDGPATVRPLEAETARQTAEKMREREREPARGANVSTLVAPNNYDPAYASGGAPRPNDAYVPVASAPPNYAPVPNPYAADNTPRPGRGEFQGAVPVPNPLRGDGKYEVQPNDSFWTISERVYGSGAYFRALAEANRGKAARPDRLPPGLVIATPPVPQLEKDYPDLCPRPDRREAVRNRADGLRGYAGATLASTAGGGRTYVVQEGDSLYTIARHELGKISRWSEIYQLNREAIGKDYDYLTPGMRLTLPIVDSQPGDRTARRSEGGAPVMR
jgi:nucleoid-associated protein YgaU